MTEQQFLTSTDPAALVAYLGERITDEQRRFFVEACEITSWKFRDSDIKRTELAFEWALVANVPLAADILRDIVGNPFHRYERDWAGMPKEIAICRLWEGDTFSVLPLYDWLQWNDGAIPKMVDAMLFEECDMPFGPGHPTCSKCGGKGRISRAEPQWLMMPAIADALEEAGCREPAILEHLRSERDGDRCAWCWNGHVMMPPIPGAKLHSYPIPCSHCNGTGLIRIRERRHWKGCWILELLKGNK